MGKAAAKEDEGRLLVQILAVRNLGTEHPKIDVTCRANGTSMRRTFVPSKRGKDEMVSVPTPEDGVTRAWQDPHGPPRLFLHLSDSRKNDGRSLGAAALDITGLHEAPYFAELWVLLENAAEPGAAVHLRASYVAQPAFVQPPAASTRPVAAVPIEAREPPPAPFGELPPRDGGHARPVLALASGDRWPCGGILRSSRSLQPTALPERPSAAAGSGLFACCGAGRILSSCGIDMGDCNRF